MTHYLFENPYPLAIALAVIGLAIGWKGMLDGRAGPLKIAPVPLVLALAVVATGLLVVTAGERGRAVVRSFVDAVVEDDLVGADAKLARNVTAHLGSARNVGHDRAFIMSGLSRLVDRFEIEDNSITRLDALEQTSTSATLHLTCWTESESWGTTRSQWQVEVREQADGAWLIQRLTCLSVNDRPPPSSW
ncbi:MAG: hypothetical protein GY715_07420 [Planctomycetes bacterium]|nr:hypothetical protein [Planctomycetota bacterium]